MNEAVTGMKQEKGIWKKEEKGHIAVGHGHVAIEGNILVQI